MKKIFNKLYSSIETYFNNECSHDGKSEIRVTKNTWKEQNQELYEMLVPSSGWASTVQGEVIIFIT